jgi:hypothetical protein
LNFSLSSLALAPVPNVTGLLLFILACLSRFSLFPLSFPLAIGGGGGVIGDVVPAEAEAEAEAQAVRDAPAGRRGRRDALGAAEAVLQPGLVSVFGVRFAFGRCKSLASRKALGEIGVHRATVVCCFVTKLPTKLAF